MALFKKKFQRHQLLSVFHIILNSNRGLNLKIVNNCDPPITLGEKNQLESVFYANILMWCTLKAEPEKASGKRKITLSALQQHKVKNY